MTLKIIKTIQKGNLSFKTSSTASQLKVLQLLIKISFRYHANPTNKNHYLVFSNILNKNQILQIIII
jgi:hypothetical protein